MKIGSFNVVRRLAVIGAFAVGIAGAARAQSLGPALFGTNDSYAANLGNQGNVGVGGTGISSGFDLSSSGSANTNSGGNNGWTEDFAPTGTPEPFTMGLAIAGIGIAARRIRNRAK